MGKLLSSLSHFLATFALDVGVGDLLVYVADPPRDDVGSWS